jgi:hypothetical protein
MSTQAKVLSFALLPMVLLALLTLTLGQADAVPKKTVGQCDIDYINGLDRCDRERETCKKNEEAACDARHQNCVNFRKADHRDCLQDADSTSRTSRPLKKDLPTLQQEGTTKSPKTLPKDNIQQAE